MHITWELLISIRKNKLDQTKIQSEQQKHEWIKKISDDNFHTNYLDSKEIFRN